MSFDVTFGICVNGDSPYLDTLIASIHDMYHLSENVGKYKIIIASQTDKWLPAKKNWIADQAQYPNLCIVHDYYKFDKFWDGWSAAMNKLYCPDVQCCAIETLEGKRSADWMINPNVLDKAMDTYPELADILRKAGPHENGPRYVNALPYTVSDLTNIQYISGGYILCKTDLLRKVRMDETLLPGSSEDVEWSERVIASGAKIIFNFGAHMRIQKPNKWAVTEMPPRAITILKAYNDWHNTI